MVSPDRHGVMYSAPRSRSYVSPDPCPPIHEVTVSRRAGTTSGDPPAELLTPVTTVPVRSNLVSIRLGLAGLAWYADPRGVCQSQGPSKNSFGGRFMDFKAVLTEIQAWPSEDRLRLIEEVWDGLPVEGAGPELPDDLKDLLDRRLDALDRDPNAVPWEVVEARALERFRR
jgi:putative addiction module component (TIGR02574 family)